MTSFVLRYGSTNSHGLSQVCLIIREILVSYPTAVVEIFRVAHEGWFFPRELVRFYSHSSSCFWLMDRNPYLLRDIVYVLIRAVLRVGNHGGGCAVMTQGGRRV